MIRQSPWSLTIYCKLILSVWLIIISTHANVISGTLLHKSSFTYLGAFRVPGGNLGGDSTYSQTMGRGGQGMTFYPNGDGGSGSLIMNTRVNSSNSERLTIEITIETPKIETVLTNLNVASVIQVPTDITGGTYDYLQMDALAAGNGGVPGGFLVYDGKLIGSAFCFYDGDNKCDLTHFSADLNFAATGGNWTGWTRVGQLPWDTTSNNGGWTGGYMAQVPSEWQTALGHPALTGQGATAVISRSSYGPSIWGFDPKDVTNASEGDEVTAEILVGYPPDHPTLGTYNGASTQYNMTTKLGGLVFPTGSDSIIVFGRQGQGTNEITREEGGGESCYGYGTADWDLVGTIKEASLPWCYDPVNSDKGNHGYPYAYQAWLYNVNTLVEAKNDAGIDVWDVVPYEYWTFDLPFETGMHFIWGTAYDPSTQRVYVAAHEADTGYSSYEPAPLIHVFQLDLAPLGSRKPSNLKFVSQ